MGAIAEMLDSTEEDPSTLQKEIAGICKLLGITVVIIAIVVMVVTALVNDVSTLSDFVTVLLLGVSLAVAAVPEGLPAILSVVLAIGVQRMARHNAVVKKLHSVETLGSASVIALGQDGHADEERDDDPARSSLRPATRRPHWRRLPARGHGVGRRARDHRPRAGARRRAWSSAAASLANNAQLTEHDGEWQIQGDPTEAAFLVAAHKLEGTRSRAWPASSAAARSRSPPSAR